MKRCSTCLHVSVLGNQEPCCHCFDKKKWVPLQPVICGVCENVFEDTSNVKMVIRHHDKRVFNVCQDCLDKGFSVKKLHTVNRQNENGVTSSVV